MFQRIRGAIDRTIAEEQARQKTLSDGNNLSRSASTSSRKPDTGKKANQKAAANEAAAENTPTADPAVFEAAFVIDDSEEPSRAGTPKPVQTSSSEEATKKDGTDTTVTGNGDNSQGEPGSDGARSVEGSRGDDAHSTKKEGTELGAPTSALTPEIKQRLRKLEKLEATYPELLRSYRVAHRRATAIEPFEKALRENTPLTSISDPSSLIEYLNQLNLKGDMVMDELKKVCGERDELQKKHEQTTEDLRKAEAALAAAKEAQSAESTQETADQQPSADGERETNNTEKVKSPVASVIGMFSPKQSAQKTVDTKTKGDDEGEDFFSYDEEIPQLQTQLASKTEEIEQLQAEVDGLRKDLTAARDSSAGLAESLEKATRELGESKDASLANEALVTQLEACNKEISDLKERLESSETRLNEQTTKIEEDLKMHAATVEEMEASLSLSDKKASDLDAELAKALAAKTISKKLIDDLNSQIDTLKDDKSKSQAKIEELSQMLQEQPDLKPEEAANAQGTSNTAGPGASSKKKNKKKKGKGGHAESATPATDSSPAILEPSALSSEIAKLKEDIAEKDALIEKLSKQRKTEEDLREEIESLQENLVDIGQDHVEAKDKIKAHEAKKADLEAENAKLTKQISASASDEKLNRQLQGEMAALQKEYDELVEKSTTLQTDLGAAQQLAQDRFRDLSELKDILQKAQPELKSLRQESAVLKTTKQELAAKQKELTEAEKREKDLKRNLSQAQSLSSDRVAEIKGLQEKLAAESNAKSQLENEKRVAGRDLRKTEAEKAEFKTLAENAERELGKARDEINKLRPRVKELEDQVHKLKREKSAAQEESEFKVQQYTNAQGLLSSMRDQATEMSIQLKEAQSQAESLEEELGEVQRLLQERTREGETMRRLLADVDDRADSKVREMRTRMEAAIEERDRIEDESSTLARRKNRETEDLKTKIRDLEREVKTLTREHEELESREKEWRRRREELETIEQRSEAETAEMRSTVSHLRSALDASESQVRDAEKQRTELRKLLDEVKQKYERTSKELRASQAKLGGRGSMDSNRSGSVVNGGTVGGNSGGSGTGDMMYLKTILLQFLEQKDGRLRAQLVPVLGKLLGFDKADEAKWLSAVQHIEVR